MAVRIFQEQLSACFKNACPDNKRLHVRIIQESCPDVTRIIKFEACADWCVSSRLCKENKMSYQQNTETLELFTGIMPGSAAKRLVKYLDDMSVAGIVRWNQ